MARLLLALAVVAVMVTAAVAAAGGEQPQPEFVVCRGVPVQDSLGRYVCLVKP